MPIVNHVQLNMHMDWLCFNSSPPRQNDHHFTDYIFRCIFVNETFCILIKIPLKFVLKGPIYNIPALVQIMAWCRPGDTLLSEPMMVSLPTHICVTRPQWINCFIVVIFLVFLIFWIHMVHLAMFFRITYRHHYSGIIMSAMASQITGASIVCSAASSGADQRKHQSSASLAFVMGIHRWPVDSPHKGPVTQ